MRVEDAVEFIRMEYAELPGLQLTFWQVQHLWRLSHDECASALKALIDDEVPDPHGRGSVRPLVGGARRRETRWPFLAKRLMRGAGRSDRVS